MLTTILFLFFIVSTPVAQSTATPMVVISPCGKFDESIEIQDIYLLDDSSLPFPNKLNNRLVELRPLNLRNSLVIKQVFFESHISGFILPVHFDVYSEAAPHISKNTGRACLK